MRVSIVIPALNAATTLAEQLAALAPQLEGADAEVIVADNGSTDATRNVAREWTDRIPHLRIVDASARPGAAAARNAGVTHATGKALLFCDADDVVTPGWYAALSAALEHHAVVAGALDFGALNARSGGMGAPAGFPLVYLPGFRGAGSGNLAVRADAFVEVGGFDESLRVGEDIDLVVRLQLAGHAVYPCDQAVVHVRLRGGIISAYRHAYSFGRAERQLRHRFLAVSQAVTAGTWTPPVRETPPLTTSQQPNRGNTALQRQTRLRKLLRPRTIDPTAFARRLGRSAGERIGRIDRTLPVVPAP